MATYTTYHINLPESLKLMDFDLKMLIAAKLYEEGRLSSGQASEVVGVSKKTFVEVLGKYNTSLFSQDLSDLEEDIANA
jgi:predicted HTH domain antitoxin